MQTVKASSNYSRLSSVKPRILGLFSGIIKEKN
nr:MAG TPA: hypothetical protein [Caudoviricetes sp.]